MKKIYLLFVIASIAFISNSSLHPSGNTGAPGDSFCGNCHTGSGGALNGEVLISGLPATIQPSTTYSITVTVTNPALNATRAGFQILALDDSNNNIGTFSNWPSNAELRMQSGRSYLGHKPAQFFNGQSEVTWTADWTSPASGSGDITIYGSSVIANGNGGNSGDRAVLTNVSGTFSGGGNPLTLTVTEDKPTSCFDSSDGWATANPSGGTTPYSYLWDNGETSQQAIFLEGGTHSVTVTDAASNTASNQVFINSPTEIMTMIDNQSDALCFGDNTGMASISASGGAPGYVFEWSDGGFGAVRNDLFAGTYTVTIRDQNGCEKDQTVTIGQPQALEAFDIIEDVTCAGGTDGAISITPTGGVQNYSYQWSNGSGDQNLTNLPSGTYNLTLTDGNNCSEMYQYTVNEPTALILSVLFTQDVSCNGNSDGQAEIIGEGGTSPYSYSWSDGGIGESRNDLQAGSYTIQITDDNNCTATASLSINEPVILVVDSIGAQPASCGGVSDGSLTVLGSGGTGQLSYLWSNGATTPTVENLTSGTYTVTVSDQNDCNSSLDLNLGALSEASLALESSQNNNCFGDSTGTAIVSIDNGAGYEIIWSDGTTGPEISNLPAGTFTVIATNPSGCTTNEIEVIISQPQAISLSQIDLETPTCSGNMDGSITIMGTGGTGSLTYVWSNGTTGSTNENLSAGTYSVEVIDDNQCTYSEIITLDEPLPISLDSSSVIDLLCDDDSTGEISVLLSGGTGSLTYLWNTGDTTSSISNLDSGDYSVTSSDENGCIRTDTFVISSPAPLVVLAEIENESEAGSNDGSIILTISGGTPGYNITWNTGANSDTLNNLSPGNYSVEIIDANGCITNRTFVVSSADCTIEASASSNDVSCFGYNDGSIMLDVTGNIGDFDLVVNPPLPLDSLVAGTYSVEIVDTAGCTVLIEGIVIGQPELLELVVDSITGSDDTNNGSIQITATGGTSPLNFSWTNSAGEEISTEEDLTNAGPGQYSLTIIDANGCVLTSDTMVISFISNTIESTLRNIKVFPNPAVSTLHIQHNEPIHQIELISMDGKVVKKIIGQSRNVSIDVLNLEDGIYILKVAGSNSSTTKKLIISRS